MFSSGLRPNPGAASYLNVERPVFTSGSTIIGYYESDPLGKQFRNNFGQNIGISLSVPIFNGRQARTSWERSKLSLKNMELTKEQGDKQLKQDIYKAYNDASSAVQKFNANKKAVEFSQNAYEFAQKRFDLGLVSLYELISSQTILLQAKTNLLLSQYDYVFKMKLLEFYKGQGLKL